jgi:hypothetical protein
VAEGPAELAGEAEAEADEAEEEEDASEGAAEPGDAPEPPLRASREGTLPLGPGDTVTAVVPPA